MQSIRASRLGWLIALAALTFWAGPVRAQIVTVTVQGIDDLVDTAKYVLSQAGNEDQATQLDGLIQAVLRGEGFKGLETRKPWGAYVTKLPPEGEKPKAVLFVPVTNETEFLGLLDRLNITPSKEPNGLRGIDLPTGQKLYLKIQAGYAYLSEDAGDLKSPVKPSGAMVSLPRGAVFHVHFDAGKLPAGVKDILIQKLDENIAKEQGKKANENEHDFAARQWGTRLAREGIVRLIRDSQAFDVSLQLDREKHLAMFDMALIPTAGTPLAGEIRDMTKASTRFGSLAKSSAAFAFWTGVMNEHVRTDLNKLLDTVFQKAMDKETSVLKRAVAEKVYKVLEPTLKSDVIDVAVALRQTQGSGPMTGVAAIRVKNGKQIEQLLKDFAAGTPDKHRQAIKFDADKSGDVNIHVVTIPESDKDAREIRQAFGAARIAMAFDEEAVVAAIGQNAVEEVKGVLAGLGKSTPRTASLQIEVHGKVFTRFEKDKARRKIMEEVLQAPGSDVIQLTVTGGDRLQFRVQASTHLLKLAKVAQSTAE